ncbi:FkbM family methyltransferase [Falsiroseomonas oryziterrae]|uniref:FkbM family methyltransferase n=1 Tax=Falsiroseomonas oryziterrae TaxID=2911368 RepID=UPI001F015073|nr:FkbM family methyltransferase [Roseomonas sp. NPKOSM-4]
MLIYDVGMHRGEDTAYYLAKGARVVAIEANPELCALARTQFAREITDGRLTILEIAVGDDDGEAVFHIAPTHSVHSSLVAMPDARPVRVRIRPLSAVFEEFGTPDFCKIDVEHVDHIVVAEIARSGRLPPQISVEAHRDDVLRALVGAGYRDFRLVNARGAGQRYGEWNIRRLDGTVAPFRFGKHSSGPFGDDLPGEWHDADGVREVWRRRSELLGPGWYDLHARLSVSSAGMSPAPEDVPASTPDGAPAVATDAAAGFVLASRIPAHALPGSRLVADFAMPSPVHDLARRVGFADAATRDECARRAPFLSGVPYEVPSAGLFEVPEVRLLHHPRAEGMCFTDRDELVRETRGSPRIVEGNDWLRWIDHDAWLRRGLGADGEVKRGAVCYDSASRNFAHFMMIMLPRLMLVDHTMAGVPILLPDLPGYGPGAGAGIPNEMLHRLADIHPLSNGNFYAPLGAGVWKLRGALIPSIGSSRWDMVLHPVVRAGFARIAAEALRRHAALHGAADLPRRIYVSRQGASRRRVANNDAVEEALAARGFVAVQLEKLDFFAQAALFAQAEAVVAVHGAGLANLLFNDGRAGAVELYPAGDPQYHFALCAGASGCAYVPLACQPANKLRDVTVDLVKLERALELLSPWSRTGQR